MSVTLKVLWCLWSTYLAALRLTISSFLMFTACKGPTQYWNTLPWGNATEVGLLRDGDSADVQIPSQEAYSLVCFHTYKLNMGISLQIPCQCDT